MKRILTVTLAALAMSTTAMAQKTIVTGTLKDSLLNETEPYATIRVYKKNDTSKPVAMSVTGSNGEINQTINGKGDFIISFESVGKKNIRKTVSLNGESTLNIGDVFTAEDSQSLKGVEVIAQKPIIKMETDKMTYNVQEDVDSKSSTVLDMLRKVPMVTVDGQDNITVNGGSFKVYVDGKPSPMFNSNTSQIFKSMPASMIKNIEVITNPGAKYDAEGTTNILNITMDHQAMTGLAGGAAGGSSADLNGYNGTVSAGVSTRGENASASISGQQGKFSYNAMGMYSHNKQDGTEITFDREQTDGSTMKYFQTGNNKIDMGMGNFGVGYELDSMSSVHATFDIMKIHLNNEGHPTTTFEGGIYKQPFSYSNTNLMKMDMTSVNASADYSRFLNADRTSSIALTYQFSSGPQRMKNYSLYDEDYSGIEAFNISNRYTDNHTKATEHTLQLDYETPVGVNQKLSLGAKYINHLNSSDSRYYDYVDGNEVYNAANSMIYDDRQQIGAAYAEYSGTFGKFSTREGLRYEHTWENISYQLGNGSDFSKNYGNLVPSASLSYSISQMSNLGLNYSMSIMRPGITYLNPYVDKTNPTALTYGNPNLEIQKSQKIGLVYNQYSSKFLFNINLSYTFCNNEIGEYSFIDNNNLLNTTYSNNIKSSNTSASVFVRWTPTSGTVVSFMGGGGYVDYQSDALNLSNHGWQWNGYANLNQTLPWKIQWSSMVMAMGNRYSLMGYSTGMSMFNTSLTKSFLDDKLSVSIRYMVPLTGKLKMDQVSYTGAYEQNMHIRVPLQQVGITVTWNFGNTKKRFQQHQSRVTNDYGEAENTNQTIGTAGQTTTGGTMGM